MFTVKLYTLEFKTLIYKINLQTKKKVFNPIKSLLKPSKSNIFFQYLKQNTKIFIMKKIVRRQAFNERSEFL